ncbi:aldose 1-epimerase, partial [Linderina pennispora]
VVLSGPEGSSCEVYLFGATVTSWKSQGKERLYVSSLAKLDGTKAVRGGIPLVFPQFGPGALPQHGFARNTTWELVDSNDHGASAVARFRLTDSEQTRLSKWPYKFSIIYTVDLTATTLSTILQFANTDEKPFEFTSLLHTYFGVPHISDAVVEGLKGVEYADKVLGTESVEERDLVSIDRNEDRVYRDVPGDVCVRYGGDAVRLKRFNFKDIVLWNPWAELAKGMGDFADAEYVNMVCVEAGTVASAIKLAPGETASYGQLLTV